MIILIMLAGALVVAVTVWSEWKHRFGAEIPTMEPRPMVASTGASTPGDGGSNSGVARRPFGQIRPSQVVQDYKRRRSATVRREEAALRALKRSNTAHCNGNTALS
jgi:hypothetical protein